MDEDTRQPAPPDSVLNVGASPASVPVEPSWGRVLATTIKVWVSWRLRPAGSGKAQPAAPRWRLAALLALALAVIAVAALQFTGVFTRTAATAARAPSAAGNTGTAGTSSEAAAWIAGQVSVGAIVACDPAMCAALQAQGVNAGRLMPLQAGAADPRGAAVMVTSASAGSQLAIQYAPAVIASFGSGKPGSRSARPSPAERPLTGPRCGPISPRATVRALNCSETRASSSPRGMPRSSGRVRWIPACW